MKVLWSLTLGIVLTALVVGCATVEQSDTPAASVATVIPTLTAEESLQQFVLCDRLVGFSTQPSYSALGQQLGNSLRWTVRPSA